MMPQCVCRHFPIRSAYSQLCWNQNPCRLLLQLPDWIVTRKYLGQPSEICYTFHSQDFCLDNTLWCIYIYTMMYTYMSNQWNCWCVRHAEWHHKTGPGVHPQGASLASETSDQKGSKGIIMFEVNRGQHGSQQQSRRKQDVHLSLWFSDVLMTYIAERTWLWILNSSVLSAFLALLSLFSSWPNLKSSRQIKGQILKKNAQQFVVLDAFSEAILREVFNGNEESRQNGPILAQEKANFRNFQPSLPPKPSPSQKPCL